MKKLTKFLSFAASVAFFSVAHAQSADEIEKTIGNMPTEADIIRYCMKLRGEAQKQCTEIAQRKSDAAWKNQQAIQNQQAREKQGYEGQDCSAGQRTSIYCAEKIAKEKEDNDKARAQEKRADMERRIADLDARLIAGSAEFEAAPRKYDVLGVHLGDTVANLTKILSKEFPEVVDKTKYYIGSGFKCAPKGASAGDRYQGDCIGWEGKPSGDPKEMNPETRKLAINLSENGRVTSMFYEQSNIFVATSQEGCEQERTKFFDGVVSKYGKPTGRDQWGTLTWGAAVPSADLEYIRNNSWRYEGIKGLSAGEGSKYDQGFWLWKRGYAVTATCGTSKSGFSLHIQAALVDDSISETDAPRPTGKPRL